MKNLNLSQKVAALIILAIFLSALVLSFIGAWGFTTSQFSF